MGLCMTRQGKLVRKEGARRVTMGYHCVPHEIFLPMPLIPFQYEKMVVYKRSSNSRMNDLRSKNVLIIV